MSGSAARREATLSARVQSIVRLARRSSFTTLAMLGLLIHAQAVAILHHHSLTAPPTSTFTADASGQSHQGPESGSDWQCQLCQLQRTFSSTAPAPSFLVEVVATPLLRE